MVLLIQISSVIIILVALLMVTVGMAEVKALPARSAEMDWHSVKDSHSSKKNYQNEFFITFLSHIFKQHRSDIDIRGKPSDIVFINAYGNKFKKTVPPVKKPYREAAESFKWLPRRFSEGSELLFNGNILLREESKLNPGALKVNLRSLKNRVKRQVGQSTSTTLNVTKLSSPEVYKTPDQNSTITSSNTVPPPTISATRVTASSIVQNVSQSDATKNSFSGGTLPQISVASGKGNKAGVTPSNTTPLSLISSVSHALLNSSYPPENLATSQSNFSSPSDNVTAGTGKPEARPATDYTDTQTFTQISPASVTESTTTVVPATRPARTSTQNLTTKPATTSLTVGSRSSLQTAVTSNGGNKEKSTTVSLQTSVSSGSSAVTDGSSVDGTPLPEPEPKEPSTQPEPEPEGEGTPEPGPDTMSTENASEPTNEPFAEPIPNWVEAKKLWKEAWPIHIYAMGTAFALLAVFSLISIIRLWRIKHLFSQKYFISLNLLMFLMGVIRAVYLLIDGYNSMETYPRIVDYFLFSTGFPCLTSSFSILFFALLQATRMQLVGPRVQKVQVLVTIIVCHFGISIVTDIVVGYFYGARIMLFLCELISVLWGLFLVIGYVYIFRRLYAAALKRQRVMERLSNVRSSRSPGTNGAPPMVSDRKPSRTDSSVTVKPSQKYTLSLAVKVTLGTAVLGLVYIGLEIYGMFGVFGIFSQSEIEAWPWWGFELGLRLVELFMCVTMSYIGTQPFRYVEGLQTRRWCFYCAACREMVRPPCGSQAGNDNLAWHEINPDLSNSAASEPESAQQATRIVYRKRSKSKSPPKTPVPYEAIQMQVKLSTQNGHAGNSVNGHINPSLESGSDSRPVSMLVFEDGFIRFRNDDELVIAMSTGDDSLAGDSAELTPSRCANELVTGAQDLSQTNANTNGKLYDRSMPYGGGLANSEHEHGIVNDGFSGGADSSRNSGVIPDLTTNPVLPLERLLLADGESDAYSASSMQSYSRSNFSESIEQELQNLIVRKPSLVVEKAKSSTNLPAEIEDSYFTDSLIFTEQSPHVLTGVRSPPHERVLQKYSNPTRSMPCSPLKASLESPPDKKKLLSRSNSDHLPLVKNASVRTKVYKNAKYFSLSDLELQIKSDDLGPGLEPVHPPPQFNPVKLISSRKVPDQDVQNGSSLQREESVKALNGSTPTTNGSSAPKKTSKTKKHQDEKSKTGDSDHSEC